MSLFTYLTIAALAVAAAATATEDSPAVEIEDEHSYPDQMKKPLLMVGIMFGGLVLGCFTVAALLRCAFCDPNEEQQPASYQPPPRRLLPLMSIEPTLNFINGLTLAGGADDHPECTICLSEFVEGEAIRILSNCGHGFHRKCIETWLSSRTSCPTCRTNCMKTSVRNKPPEHQQQQQQQQQLDLEAANR